MFRGKPGRSSWGYSEQEALANIKDAAEIYIEDMIDAGEAFPTESDNVEIIDQPAHPLQPTLQSSASSKTSFAFHSQMLEYLKAF